MYRGSCPDCGESHGRTEQYDKLISILADVREIADLFERNAGVVGCPEECMLELKAWVTEAKEALKWSLATCHNASIVLTEIDEDEECEEVFEKVRQYKKEFNLE
jgi:hypothetical protein